jgi:hypothetical protein
MSKTLALLTALLAASFLAAEEPGPIQDNSFLVEEAYNQEPGVVQHINTYTRSRVTHDWLYTFTQEWPAPAITHQLSYTLPYQRLNASPDGKAALGDVALNYRYQLLGDGEAPVAIAPRFSLLLPTGDEKQLRGNGAVGYQMMLPVSAVLAKDFVTHFNLGATYIPQARNERGEKADLTGWNLGQSFIWLTSPTFNVMLEVAYNSMDKVTGPGARTPQDSLYVSPGFRWAINFPSGLQIVPGLAFPIGVGPSRGERSVFFYLSFEHPMWHPGK